MYCAEVLSGAILDSRRDGVQVHACHFSHPPSLTVAEGTLYSCLYEEDGQDGFPDDLRGSCGLRAHGSCPFPYGPPELSGSGPTSWPRPLDEAKLPRRMVQV